MDQTIVSTALPTITHDLNGSQTGYQWVGTAYLLVATALSPLYGKLSAVFGRKQILFPSVVVFLLGSGLCGGAKSMTWLCIARGVQGAGGGGILQLTQIVISDIIPLQDRGKYSGLIGATWGIRYVVRSARAGGRDVGSPPAEPTAVASFAALTISLARSLPLLLHSTTL